MRRELQGSRPEGTTVAGIPLYEDPRERAVLETTLERCPAGLASHRGRFGSWLFAGGTRGLDTGESEVVVEVR